MKILIVKTSALGDIIQAFPVLQYLKNCFPHAQIDWVVENGCAPLVEAHPCINQAIKMNTKKWRKEFWKKEIRNEFYSFRQQLRRTEYDLLIDLQGNLKSGFVNFLTKAAKKAGFGCSTVHEWPNLFFTNQRSNPPKGRNIREDYLFVAQNAIGDFNTEIKGVKLRISDQEKNKIQTILQNPLLNEMHPRIMVCTGSNWPNKQLGKESLSTFLKLMVQQIHARFVFVWGTEDEKQLAHELTSQFPHSAFVADKMGLATLQNLMAELDLVIAMDSLPLHLAATTPTPTYSVFGASSANKYKPLGKFHESFQGECPFGRKFEKRCPILRTCSSGKCVKDIHGEALFNNFLEWWKKISTQPKDIA
jgi:heptosyltransferase-1